MKIRMEIDEDACEDEIIIHCKELTDEIISLQRQVAEAVQLKMQLSVTNGEAEYYLPIEDILFLESNGSMVAVHTKNHIFESRKRLYELEELLPGSFMRISKSTILNTTKIWAIHKNITGASEVELAGSNKRAYVSRSYIRALMSKLEEKRLKR